MTLSLAEKNKKKTPQKRALLLPQISSFLRHVSHVHGDIPRSRLLTALFQAPGDQLGRFPCWRVLEKQQRTSLS